MYTYPREAKLSERFKHLLYYCIRKECPSHGKSSLERIGDMGLYPFEKLPKAVAQNICDPKLVAIYIWLFLEVIVCFFFYPSITMDWISYFYSFIPEIPWWLIRFTLYLLTVETILAYFLRAEGRLLNKDLMTTYYGS